MLAIVGRILFFIATYCHLLVTQFVTWFQQADLRVPIQYTRRAATSGSESFLPLKVNVSGVIPVIFASSFIITPATILMAFKDLMEMNNGLRFVIKYLVYKLHQVH